MACFLVPAGEAAVTTVVGKLGGKKSRGAAHEQAGTGFGRKLKWLSNMLWGGSALLAFEHVWHGELTLWFPFRDEQPRGHSGNAGRDGKRRSGHGRRRHPGVGGYGDGVRRPGKAGTVQ